MHYTKSHKVAEQLARVPPFARFLPPTDHRQDPDAPSSWWFDSHFSLSVTSHCSTESSARVRAVARARDALYELYCDATHPLLADDVRKDGALGLLASAIYGCCDESADAASGERSAANVARLRARLADRRSVHAVVAALPHGVVGREGALRNLAKNVEAVYTSAVALARTFVAVHQ